MISVVLYAMLFTADKTAVFTNEICKGNGDEDCYERKNEKMVK